MDRRLQDGQCHILQLRLLRRDHRNVLLGNVAYRTGQRLEWDAANMKVTNYPPANDYLQREYRPGWKELST